MKIIGAEKLFEPKILACPVNRTTEKHLDLVVKLSATGIIDPIKVRIEGSKHIICGGFERFTAGLDAGLTEFPCIIYDIDEFQGLCLQIIDNPEVPDRYLKTFLTELALLVPSIGAVGLARSTFLPVSEVRRLLGAPDFGERLLMEIALGRIPVEERREFLTENGKLPHSEFITKAIAREREIKESKREGKSSRNVTPNQLIALLEIHRTGNPEASGVGTLENDLKVLIRRGLVTKNPWRVTEKGRKVVENCLLKVE